jgi:hypothetical protein
MVGTGNGLDPYTESAGSKSSSKASEAVPYSHECEGRDLARARTAVILKPGLYGKGPGLFAVVDVAPKDRPRSRR